MDRDRHATVQMGDQTATAQIAPAKKWTVAIIPHEHLDIGFTDYPAKIAELHAQSIDSAMELIKKTPDFRWTLDGSWVANQYLNGRSDEGAEGFSGARSRRQHHHPAGVRQPAHRQRFVGGSRAFALQPTPAGHGVQVACSRCGANR